MKGKIRKPLWLLPLFAVAALAVAACSSAPADAPVPAAPVPAAPSGAGKTLTVARGGWQRRPCLHGRAWDS